MSDLKLTAEKTMTFMESKDGKGVFKTPKRLESFGEAQNEYNKLVMENINDMKKRICHLEDEQEISVERFKRCASELQSFKAELDRLKLTSKLNTNAIDRLNKAIQIANGEE